MGRLVVYAACLEGSDPIRLFEKRLNSRRGNAFGIQALVDMGYR